MKGEYSTIHLAMEQDVEVTEYYFPEFSLSNFLSNLGGILGLWLGVGVMQLGGYGALLAGHFKTYFKRIF